LIPLELIREFETQMRDLRIGGTSFRRAQKLEKRFGIRRLHLKMEGDNPSGTHKDRAALIHALDARKKGLSTLTAVSCGNYGAALAYVAEKLDMGCQIYIPRDFAAPRRQEIERHGAKVVAVDGDYEAANHMSASDAVRNGWYNANPGGTNKDLGIFAYTFIAKEIAQSLGRQPDWVSVPVGNGTLMGGVWQGFRAMSMKPRMLGVSNNNSAIHGLALGEKNPVDVPNLEITETNEPLSGNFLLDSEEVVSAVTDSNGSAQEVPDRELESAAEIIMKEEGVDILPAAASSVWGITRLESRNHVFVAIVTAKGHFG
jgi:threonine synthase